MLLSSDPSRLLASARDGDRRALARLITMVEDGGSQTALRELFATTGRAWVIGVTGPPGTGKSTLTDRLISEYRRQSQTVAVVVVDPSSPFTGGALLGDRLRMQQHVSDGGVYVRSMSTRGHLGGIADATAKVVAVLDSVGFDVVLVETVGVGQSEVEVAELADTTMVVLPPRSGDDVQAAKAGLLEVAQILCVNKADLGGTDEMVRYLSQMLEMAPAGSWQVPVLACSAASGHGVGEVIAAIEAHRLHLLPGLDRDRRDRLERLTRRALITELAARLTPDAIPPQILDAVVARQLDPWSAARDLADR